MMTTMGLLKAVALCLPLAFLTACGEKDTPDTWPAIDHDIATPAAQAVLTIHADGIAIKPLSVKIKPVSVKTLGDCLQVAISGASTPHTKSSVACMSEEHAVIAQYSCRHSYPSERKAYARCTRPDTKPKNFAL